MTTAETQTGPRSVCECGCCGPSAATPVVEITEPSSMDACECGCTDSGCECGCEGVS